MNRYPLWKYILIGIVLIIGLVYTLPNFYGESPAVQVTSGKATVKVTEQTLSQVETALANANLKPNGLFFEQGAQQNTIRVRFDPTQTEEQLRAREVIEKEPYRGFEFGAEYASMASFDQCPADVSGS